MHNSETQTSVGKKLIVEDYAEILEQHQLKYSQVNFYYQVGEIEKVQGWILHLSCVWPKIPDLLTAILPLLIEHDVPFKVVRNKQKASLLCNGSLGYHQLGKAFCLYPHHDEIALTLAKELLGLTIDFRGCSIPTDFHLGGIVYTRYGSFRPQLGQDQIGRVERYINDAKGQLIKDEYNTPFKFPKGIPWPFQEITAPVEEVPTTFLKDCYKVLSTLKNDAKGRVMKALRLHRFRIQRIIIKEAKHGVCVDENGSDIRDIRDRLFWQYILLSHLQGKAPVPKAYDFFRENGNSYLAMEYIQGKSLGQVIQVIYKSSIWFLLHHRKKLLLLDYLLQLLDTINKLHQQGYIHRDINWVNFILGRDNRFIAIDLEMAYSLRENTPHPPFSYGTPGFMSPEQLEVKQPEVKQDIYSLGALMIKFFTNLSPVKFEHDFSRLPDHLNFFIRNKAVSQLIGSCLCSKPTARPDLTVVRSTLENFRIVLSASESSLDDQGLLPIDRQSVRHLIQRYINTLGKPVMVQPGSIWHSLSHQDNEPLANLQAGITYNPGLYSGVSGVMYALARAHGQGYNIKETQEVYNRSLQYLCDNFLCVLPNALPGLYYGAAGVALSLAEGVEAGLIDPEYQSEIKKCLEITANGLNMAHGVAGQGIAVLHCLNVIDIETAERLLGHFVSVLLENQQKDGSWLTIPPEGGRTIHYTGFSLGVAGICFFLLKYYDYYPDDRVLSALSKALHWLRRQSKKNKKGTYWYAKDRKKELDLRLDDGVAGVVLCFVKAYKVLDDPVYRKIAEDALHSNIDYPVYSNFSLGKGMTGLAETYLAAAEVFENELWLRRAEFILHIIMRAYRYDDESSCYWITEDNKTPTADFMVGNSGILHLLMKYLSQQKSEFLW